MLPFQIARMRKVKHRKALRSRLTSDRENPGRQGLPNPGGQTAPLLAFGEIPPYLYDPFCACLMIQRIPTNARRLSVFEFPPLISWKKRIRLAIRRFVFPVTGRKREKPCRGRPPQARSISRSTVRSFLRSATNFVRFAPAPETALPSGLIRRAFFSAMLLVIAVAPSATAADRGRARHVLVVVCDGLRPDAIDEKNTPTLYGLSKEGVFFDNHHSIYPTSTEVNGVALATGVHPNRSGVIANREYRPQIDPLQALATESIDAVRAGDSLSDGKYLGVETVAEVVQAAGLRAAVAGTKPVALLHNRLRIGLKAKDPRSVTIFAGKALPEETLPPITRALGAFPATITFPNSEADTWTARALTEFLWKSGVPDYTVLWLSDPDYSQHNSAPGSPTALAALKSCDDILALLLKDLDAQNAAETTDIFVVSDHGFSTISKSIDLATLLSQAGFRTFRKFNDQPQHGDILVVTLGGSSALYVIGHDRPTVERLVDYLQRSDFTGVLLTREPVEGTFTLDQVHLNTPFAPDVLIALRWTSDRNEYQVPGLLQSDLGRKPGQGTHASLSPFDVHNTLIAKGPDFRRGVKSELPSGNLDLAPTILWILGLPPPDRQDGRVLFEAINEEIHCAKPETQLLTASRNLEGGVWRQYLRLTNLGPFSYIDEGNGALDKISRDATSPTTDSPGSNP
jgi:arylsulfatase A-like enzyme